MAKKAKKIGRPKIENPDPVVSLTLPIPAEVHAAIKADAKAEGRSMRQQIIWVLRRYLGGKK